MRETNSTGSAPAPAERLDLDAFFADLKHGKQPILFVPTTGNAGDALISHATRQMFDRLGVGYEWALDYRRLDPSGRVVVYSGGGNLIPSYSSVARALRWANGRASRLIVLPHTIRGNEELLAELGPETDLICREPVSYDHVRGAVRSARCHIADDLGLAIDVQATLAAPRMQAPFPIAYVLWQLQRPLPKSFRRWPIPRPLRVRESDRLLASRLEALAQGGAPVVLDAFRMDSEKTDITIPPGNLDLSDLFAFGTWHPELCHASARHLLRYLDLYDEVRTNRLHVAIGAALLGKRVKMHPNSYDKNQSVYDFSMRARFPNVEWVERPEAS